MLFNHSVASKAWLAVAGEDECPARGKVARAALEAQAEVFATAAPTIGGVIKKLSIWWGEELYDESYESSVNRIIIGDLTRLELEAVGATELEASGRSPEEAAAHLAEWQSTLADYAEQEKLFVEGPSPRWEDRAAIEIINAMDYSAGVLFELPAPNLYGVIRKLELLWEDDRFDTVGGGAVYVQIMRDLHRLARELAASKPDSQ
jgi:hypothetical protein